MAATNKPQPKTNRKSLTQDRLKEILHYDPDTGVFTRLVDRPGPWGGHKAGTRFTGRDHKGYLWTWIDGYHYKLHVLAWLYIHGVWPFDQIDHIDMEKSNNRIDNLRESSNGNNKANSHLYKNNTSGFKCIRLHKPNGRWQAIGHGNGTGPGGKSLGYYATAEEAADVAAEYGKKTYGEFYRER